MPPARPKPHPESLAVGALLTALVALGQISTSIYIPSMPSLVAALNTGPEPVNLTLSGFLMGFAVAQLVYGPLSDRFGRRPVLLAGVALYLLASLACAVVASIEALIAARILQGVAACSGPVLGRAVVRDVYGHEKSAEVLAYIGVALAVSPAVAPIIGGYLQVWFGWQANFVFLGAVGAVILLAVWRLLEETGPEPDHGALDIGGMARSYGVLLGSRAYLGYILSATFVFAGLMAFTAGSPFVFIDLMGLSPDRFGMLSVFNVAGFLAGSLAAGRLTARVGIDRMLLVGVGLSVVGGAAMAAFALAGVLTITAIIGPMTVFLAGMGVVLPTGIAGAMGPFPRIAGAASALFGFVQMTVAGLASLAVGLSAVDSQLPMAVVVAAMGAAAFVAVVTLVRPPRRGLTARPRGPRKGTP